MSKLYQQARNFLSYSAIGFLMFFGFQTAFYNPALPEVRQPHWLGYWVLASAVALADRMRSMRKNEAKDAAQTGVSE